MGSSTDWKASLRRPLTVRCRNSTRSFINLILPAGVKSLLLRIQLTAAQPVKQQVAPSAKYVILVTIDGFRPDFYLDPLWGAVNLRQLMQDGVYAQSVTGVFTTVTYPSHTTIITGVKPSRHGIYYNTPFEPEGPTGRWYWDAAAIKVPAIWDAVRQAGLTSASLC